MKLRIIFFLIIIGIGSSCSTGSDTNNVTRLSVSDFIFTLSTTSNNIPEEKISQFILRVSTVRNDDITFWETLDYSEYRSRMEVLNFEMRSYFSLINKLTGEKHEPLLVHMENTYGAAPYRDFHITFPINPELSEDWQLIFNDEIFNTGVSRFKLPQAK